MKLRYLIYIGIYIFILLALYISLPSHLNIEQEEGFIEIYFCDQINCAHFLNSFLNKTKTASCALYDLDEESIIKVILEQNISVKLFEENYETWMPTNILSIGSKGLMHHKFCVANDYVITGSWNPTERGTQKNNNYIIYIKSENLAKNYLAAYESLEKTQEAKSLHLNLSGVYIENYFCPAHNCEYEVIAELQQANKSIYMLAFSFTSKPIAEVLVDKRNNNLTVQVLFEKTRIADYSQYDYLNNSNVSVYKDTNPYTMHEKVFVIDRKTVILGSYNPTSAANEKNDENILIIHDVEIAELFVEEFEKLTFLS